MRKTLVWLVAGMTALTCGCRRGEETSGEPGRPRIALVVKTLNNPFFLDMQKEAEAAAREQGVELIVQAAEREIDVEKQMQIVENLIQSRVDVLCIAPSGSREILPVIGKANKAGIPVIVVDTRLDEEAAKQEGVTYVTFIGSDNYQGAKIAGEHVAKKLNGKGAVIVLEGIPGHETADNRLRGFRDGIAGSPDLKIIASQPANWERDQGFNVTQNLLQAHPRIDGVFACNDMMALGALEAIAAAGKAGQILVVGFDAVAEACKEIAAGRLDASAAQHPGQMGRLAIENAVKVLRGETIPKDIPVAIELITREKLQGSATQ